MANAECFTKSRDDEKALYFWKNIYFSSFWLFCTYWKQFWKPTKEFLAEGRKISLAHFPKMIMRNNCFKKLLCLKMFLSTQKKSLLKNLPFKNSKEAKKMSGNICMKTLILMFQRTYKTYFQQHCTKYFWREATNFLVRSEIQKENKLSYSTKRQNFPDFVSTVR